MNLREQIFMERFPDRRGWTLLLQLLRYKLYSVEPIKSFLYPARLAHPQLATGVRWCRRGSRRKNVLKMSGWKNDLIVCLRRSEKVALAEPLFIY